MMKKLQVALFSLFDSQQGLDVASTIVFLINHTLKLKEGVSHFFLNYILHTDFKVRFWGVNTESG